MKSGEDVGCHVAAGGEVRTAHTIASVGQSLQNPRWETSFVFEISDPFAAMAKIKVMSGAVVLGSTVESIYELSKCIGMTKVAERVLDAPPSQKRRSTVESPRVIPLSSSALSGHRDLTEKVPSSSTPPRQIRSKSTSTSRVTSPTSKNTAPQSPRFSPSRGSSASSSASKTTLRYKMVLYALEPETR
ncbi:hypothetical protein CYMTET_43397 [Cymbomonas tetramitiformis]|uniref:C2 domain-containing protein n=1 Tax=Cymbomonas tetramitiformis TaxID=36881 RepID=A0AAE0C457_9CHLO|nr:hypothetical protein CYMTET_43397 [Cymbomonas tetramitiformis]